MKLDASEKPKFATGEDLRGTHLHLNKLRQNALSKSTTTGGGTSEQRGYGLICYAIV